MGAWNFNDTEHRIFLGTQDEKEFFLALFDDIDTSNVLTAGKALRDAEGYYTDLIESWDEKLNKHHKNEFEKI